MTDREQEYMAAPTELLGLPTKQWIDQSVKACRGAALPEVAAALAGLYELLTDKRYVRTRADYNRGHLSYCNQLESRERAALGG